ncbi:unnamed protein product [Adineta ricciae]|uniref:Uncharacterized protein n=1 Tax=Adineta ricciae TaxID=249248 RepID=A0A815R5B0_ADIRI|nr:unnamed protein product [Adineta ricciae]CAF1546081.1 unnamed protein product [Adineta ricciae]
MAKKSYEGCSSGRGKPVYLLDRRKYEPSFDSDYGVSKLFDRSPSIGTLSSSNASHGRSQLCKSSIDVNTNMSSIHGISDGIGPTRSEHSTRIMENYSMDNIHQRTYETSELSSPTFMNTSSNLPICLNKDENHDTNVSSNYDYNSNASFEHENMFWPYTRLFSDDENEPQQKQQRNNVSDWMDTNSENADMKDGQTAPKLVQIVVPKYDSCCMQDCPKVSECGPTSHYCPDWSPFCVSFASLATRDMQSYLKRKKVICKIAEDDVIINEKNLVANRLCLENILIDDSMYICPKHRSSYGINRYISGTKCHHPDHDAKRPASKSDLRTAKIDICLRVEGFPIGGK